MVAVPVTVLPLDSGLQSLCAFFVVDLQTGTEYDMGKASDVLVLPAAQDLQ